MLESRSMWKEIVSFACFLGLSAILTALTTPKAHAVGVTYTVCDSGCDVTTLSDALALPGISNDTIKLTSGYTFVAASEGTTLSIPDDIVLTCETGSDAFGDAAEAAVDFTVGSNTTIEHCTFENTNFDATGKTNVQFDDNTFTSAALSNLVFTSANTVNVTNNHGIQKVQLQTADDVTISGNSFECRFENSCINVVTAGVPDYSLSSNISSNVLVTNNTITNYRVSNGGSMINVYGGENVQFTNNTITSAVTLNDVFMIMVTIANAQAEFTGNYVTTPQKIGGANSGTWVFQVNNQSYDADVLFEHNTIYQQNQNGGATGDSCIGLFDDGTRPNIPVTITANYNLCYQGTLPLASARGNGFRFEYTIGSADLTFNESYSGFYNVLNHVSDITGTYTTLGATTLSTDPMFRRENIDTSDDLHLHPASRYLDINGTQDIGAYSAARGNSFHIVNGGTVDYTTVHATDTYPILNSLKTGDTLTYAAGGYTPLHITGDSLLTGNITISGAGDTTTFDSGLTTSPLSLTGIANSTIINLKVLNSSAPVTTTYAGTFAQFTDGVTDYDDAALIGIPNRVIFFVGAPSGGTCASIQPEAGVPIDMTPYISAATGNINVALVDYLGVKLTLFGPSNYIDSAATLLNCANPGDVTIEHFVNNIFTRNNGVYTYNTAAASAAGVGSKSGDFTPITLTRNVVAAEEGGVLLNNSSGNTLSHITSTNNDYALVIKGTSANNVIQDSTLTNSSIGDIFSLGAANNTLANTLFNRASSVITGAGDVIVQYAVRAKVTGFAGAPLAGESATFTSQNSAATTTLTTDATGFTPYSSPITAYILSSTDLTEINGGYNPYTLSLSTNTAHSATSKAFQLNTPNQLVTFELPNTVAGNGGGTKTCPNGSIVATSDTCQAPSLGGGGGGSDRGSTIIYPRTTPQEHPAAPVQDSTGTGTWVGTGATVQPDCARDESSVVPFEDISGHWAKEYIYALYQRCVIEGKQTTIYAPDVLITRAEVIKTTLRLFDMGESRYENIFADVGPDDWFAPYVIQGATLGIIRGYDQDQAQPLFKPEQPITRAEALKILLVSKQAVLQTNGFALFSDVHKQDWFYPFVAYAIKHGIIEGFETPQNVSVFKPDNHITRAEFAKMAMLTYLLTDQ